MGIPMPARVNRDQSNHIGDVAAAEFALALEHNKHITMLTLTVRKRLLPMAETLINGQRNEIGDDGGDCLRRALQNNSAITWLSLRVRRALAMDSNDI